MLFVVLCRPTLWNEFGETWSSVESIDMRFELVFHFKYSISPTFDTKKFHSVFRTLRVSCRRNSAPIGLLFYLFCSLFQIDGVFISIINEFWILLCLAQFVGQLDHFGRQQNRRLVVEIAIFRCLAKSNHHDLFSRIPSHGISVYHFRHFVIFYYL